MRLIRGRRVRVVQLTRLHLADLFGEALAGMAQRPGRSMLTMLGTVLGIGAFVAVLGLTSTASGQIDKRFTVLSATEVTVQDVGSGDTELPSAMSFSADAVERITALNGVVSAGLWWKAPLQNPRIETRLAPKGTSSSGDGTGLEVYAVDQGAMRVMRPVMAAGVPLDAFHVSRAEHVAVLGAAAATRLGVTRLDGTPAIFINGTPYTVIGIVSDVRRRPEALLSVMIPSSTALTAFGEPRQEPRASMLIETRLGAAQLIAGQAPLVIRPDRPSYLKAMAAPDPRTLRSAVTGDLNSLFLLLAGISLFIGAVGIANTTLVAVLERTGEIGLRRSLGARPRHIAGQFLAESTTLGLLGGLVGTSLGVAVVLLVAVIRDWTAVLEPWTVLPAPLIGTVVGLLAGTYPALRAARIEPVEALRR